MLNSASVGDMVSQSREVLTKPSVASFERFEKAGGLQQALIYVGIGAAINGIFGLAGGLAGFLNGIIVTLLGFLIFTYLIYWIGKQQGGTGSYDEVAYTFSLFWVPIALLSGIAALILTITVIGIFFLPILGIATMIAYIYFANLAVQSSLNMSPGGKVWLILILSGIGTLVVSGLIGRLLNIG